MNVQAMERSVKSVELTCNRMPTTTTHDIPPVLKRLPQDWEITEDLRAAWANVPAPLRVYSDILYRGLNQHTGKTTDIKTIGHHQVLSSRQNLKAQEWYLSGEDPREFFHEQARVIEEAIEIAEGDFLHFAEKHLEKFEKNL